MWLLLASAAPVHSDAAGATLNGRVTRVFDGDTIDVTLSSGPIRVRLQGVDAPERDQLGGDAARQWLIPQLRDQQVSLEPVSQDQYDRMLAVVHLRNRNINRELVQAGHAWAYRHYLRREDRELCSIEERARRARSGLWATTAHAPWEFRATSGKGAIQGLRQEYCRGPQDCHRPLKSRLDAAPPTVLV